MKAFAMLIITGCIWTNSFCQQREKIKTGATTDGSSVISLYPFQFIFSNFKLGFEQKASGKLSVRGVASLGLSEHSTVYDVDNYSAFSAEVQVRYFPMHKSPSGFYGAAYLYDKGASFEQQTEYYFPGPIYSPVTVTYNLNSLGAGVLFGVQLFAGKIISFDFYAGGGPNIPLVNVPDYSDFNSFGSGLLTGSFRRGINFHSGFNMGLVLK